MLPTRGYATHGADAPFEPFSFERREPGANDVLIEILFCGICHSDIHQVRNEWGGANYPMVPGHEIVGRVTRVGSAVTKFKEGDLTGVGCFVDSCRECASCRDGEEQYCEQGMVATYNSLDR
ncbi:MAG: alcohol dehydrogenase, partial [Abditibacteriota bacterium]|nr:alcohol dehydrogenase [Abditibacteriota bacterium]